MGRNPKRLGDPLTPAELRVLRAMADGIPQKGTRRSARTVKAQLASVRVKLGAANTVEAVAVMYERDPHWRDA